MAFLSQFINHDAPILNQYLVLTATFVAVELGSGNHVLATFAEKLNNQLLRRGFMNAFNKFTGGSIYIGSGLPDGNAKNLTNATTFLNF